jgi:uncharacterized protein YcnI
MNASNPRAPGSSGRRAALCTALLLAAVVAVQGHITVQPTEMRASSFQKFTVRVPTERPEPTVKVRLEYPTGLGAPRIRPKAGWNYELEKDASGNVTAITWSGGEIGPDEFDEFEFQARTPTAPGPLVFKADQTYKGGEVVAWAGPPGDARPAATVEVRDSTFGMTPAVTAESDDAEEAEEEGEGNWMNMLSMGLSILAVVLASVGMTRRA